MTITQHDIYMETNRLAVLATTAIERAMKRLNLSRSELAKHLGISLPRVNRVLEGETDMTWEVFVLFGLVCNVRWKFDTIEITDKNSPT